MTADTELRPSLEDVPAPSRRWVRVSAAVAVLLVGLAVVVLWRTTSSSGPTYASPEAMAAKLGCSESFQAANWAAGPSEPSVGTCTLSGNVLTLATFPSSDTAHVWWIAAMQYSPHLKNDVTSLHGTTGANWAVTTPDDLSNGVSQVLGAN